MTLPNIAFLGMGVMGGPMAANLARAGYPVAVWNRTADRPGVVTARDAGCRVADSIADAVSGAAFVLSCLGDENDVAEVLTGDDGAASAADDDALFVDFSTIGPDAAKTIAEELAEDDFTFLDAPVSGGDIGAQNGTLTIMVGGDDAAFTRAQPIFDVLGATVRHCGTVGNGQAVKLCNQVLAAVNMMAVTEAVRLAEAMDLDPALMVEVCKTGAAGSWALANLGPKIIARDFAPGFMIKHILKDLRLVEECNDAADGDDLPGTELATELFEEVAGLGGDAGAELGTQAMIRAFED